ncbi:uncharacterized protein L201_001392 [Kwoniella dendrophila CBS 6074]|uniref:Uncharacterized protein n=1 Tax=Kwoniella dendrophila CBS 6074 TaxID=1295534 RepID=A0AAX4JM77_9TREE
MAQTELPRHDFYQNSTHITLSIYLKGYGNEGIKENVEIQFDQRKITIELPEVPSGVESRSFTFEPLYDNINPTGSTSRVLSTKIEIKLSKLNPINWPTLLSPDSSKSPSSNFASQPPSNVDNVAGPSTSASSSQTQPQVKSANTKTTSTNKKNWDKLLEDELNEDEGGTNKDPNAGGDAALQKFFSQIYGNADDDTKRAMIKSFTESGGTTLSTDWSNIGKEKTPVRPPEGMEEKKM